MLFKIASIRLATSISIPVNPFLTGRRAGIGFRFATASVEWSSLRIAICSLTVPIPICSQVQIVSIMRPRYLCNCCSSRFMSNKDRLIVAKHMAVQGAQQFLGVRLIASFFRNDESVHQEPVQSKHAFPIMAVIEQAQLKGVI